MNDRMLMSLTEGGMQYLIAGARASIGMKAGRYMYEVKIIEALNPSESMSGQGRGPQPRQLVRLGFSTAGTSLVLGDSEDGVYFDSEGFFCASKQKKKTCQQFTRDQVIGLLLNLDPKSPNANTVSIFRDGERLAEPQPLPEQLHGKPLFPHISFRNVSIQVNMGPTHLKPLAFNCRMVQGAAYADTVEGPRHKGDKFEILLPVAFPDEGTFDWLDDFLQKNPSYVELSDRRIQDWAASSGLAKPRQAAGASNDKPSFGYQIPGMDDMSIQRVLKSVAATVPRNYVVMEVKSNLVAADRAEVLKRFSAPHFKTVAQVMMGEPKPEHKRMLQVRALKVKQEKADQEWRLKKAEKDKLKAFAKRQKEIAEMRRKAEEQRKKQAEEAIKKQQEAKRKAEQSAEEKKEEEESKIEVDVKEEDVKEEVKDEEDDEEEDDDGLGSEPPKVELTEEEKQLSFLPKLGCGDLAPAVLSKSFSSFTIPDKEEGFDDVRYEWQPAAKSKEYLRNWVLETKRTSCITDLQPSPSFKEKQAAWTKQFLEWQSKQKIFRAAPKPTKKEDAPEEKKIDIFAVQDVNDMRDGEPLYANFEPEDWALLQLRYELHLLQEAFKTDVNDPDRVAIPDIHLSFYFHKYFTKNLNPSLFALKTNNDLVDLVKDTVTISSDPLVLTSQLSLEVDSADIFVKFTEDARRHRRSREAAGDETVRLKFTVPVVAIAAPKAAAPVQAPKAAAQQPQQQKWQNQSGGAGGKGNMMGMGHNMGMMSMGGGWGGKGGGKW
ncbi:unnamed protein product [Polarella glacialis]|uniref:B30.2/SPRY domain-containing protein n=1 Tax=Polarella glacialis TaxID=89957 RepID=A0A813D0B6_POLGL|nr:unnamed protein product [Polarella glacialis]